MSTNTTPEVYRSIYTGREIEELLGSIKRKIDILSIVDDFNTGGSKRPASAETVKILYKEVQTIKDPNFFADLIKQIPGFNLFTDADKKKLDGLSEKFRGSFKTATERDEAVKTASFTGGELTYVMDVGNGAQELSWWDPVYSMWRPTVFSWAGFTPSRDVPTGLVYTFEFKKSDYRFVKLAVLCQTTTLTQAFEVDIVHANDSIFWKRHGSMGNTNALVTNIDVVETDGGTKIKLQMVCTQAITLRVKRISEI